MLISQYLPEIIHLLSESPILFLSAPTGSGKSLGVPAALAMVNSRVMISVPTRASAYSLSERLKLMLPNIDIGYAAEGESHYTDKTKVIYVTSGHLRKKLLSCVKDGNVLSINFCDVLFIDEIHSGSMDNSVNIALWEYIGSYEVEVPRLLLASGTFPKKLEEMFNYGSMYEIPGQSYDIEIMYHAKTYDVQTELNAIFKDLITVVRNLYSNTSNGDMIIFLPGSAEVIKIVNSIQEISLKNAVVIPAYGALPMEELSKIFEPIPGKRKIIAATNVAESSLTIDNLDIVIDSLLEKVAVTSSSGGIQLELTRCSKDSARQRAGRTGRIRAGYCYRMITEEDFENLIQTRDEEILRLPLNSVILELLNSGIDPKEILKDVPERKIKSTKQVLLDLDCIKDDKPTRKGMFASQFPMSIKNSAVLYDWIQAKKPIFPALILLELVDSYGPSYFYIPKGDFNLEEYKEKTFGHFRGKSDVETFLRIWNSFMNYIEEFPHNGIFREGDVKKWCAINYINHRKWKEMLSNIKNSLKSLRRLKYDFEIGSFHTENLIMLLEPFLVEVYKDDIVSSQGNVYVDNKGNNFKLDNKNSVNNLESYTDKKLLPFNKFSLSTGNNALNIISVALNIDENTKMIKGRKVEVVKREVVKKKLKKVEKTPEISLEQDIKNLAEEFL